MKKDKIIVIAAHGFDSLKLGKECKVYLLTDNESGKLSIIAGEMVIIKVKEGDIIIELVSSIL